MNENDKLMKLASGVDDYPIAFIMDERGKSFDWKDRLPKQVIYCPESVFQRLCPAFVEELGAEDYYGTVELDKVRLNRIIDEISRNQSDTEATNELLRFLNSETSKNYEESIYYDGP
ncbi:hypothetical protein [Pelagicoccus sp. SDUM812003]|uniref:hypothetical protein n=1 Tax=Pelagicoccus sp. SDUM812003 TaxID=3041267 RepID=UPI00280C96C9|nr:hypothetical protein [Pelagicoccus sp. SDUM812003]MDQ8203966.1 hypothetical protein [Pelagicoccus sp. SDUM812003]